jgi:2-hydroxy-3-keto-5-methylthiopentenyl-1-phosphate phosphatase
MRLVRATKDEVDALLDSIEIDEGFVRLLETCAAHGVEVHIISDGFDYCIDRILTRQSMDLRNNLRNVRILSSHLESSAGRWLVDFPWFHRSCAHGCATCKPAMMSLLNRDGGPTIFVGDGLSDKYAAASADLVFAKDKLADYCRAQQIKHQQFDSLAEVAMQVNELLLSNAVIEREAIEGVGA